MTNEQKIVARKEIVNQLQYWLTFVETCHAPELINNDTFIIMPAWPTVGQVKNWIEAIKD